jgi:hypothetical protein
MVPVLTASSIAAWIGFVLAVGLSRRPTVGVQYTSIGFGVSGPFAHPRLVLYLIDEVSH